MYCERCGTFKNGEVIEYRRMMFHDCHMWGGCVPDPEKAIITQPDTRKRAKNGSAKFAKGSCATNIYFLCCDGRYRNALRQVLDGVRGDEVEVNADKQMYKLVCAELQGRDDDTYGGCHLS